MMKEDTVYEVRELAGGALLVAAYCPHREAGATLTLRADRPQRWSIIVPIDALEWAQFVALRIGAYAAGHEALGLSPKPPSH
jgi:hypothetical protein